MMSVGNATRRLGHRGRRVCWAVLGCLLASLALTAGPAAVADTGDQKKAADAKVAALQDALDGVSTELAAAYTALEGTKAQLPAAESRLATATSAARAADAHNAEVATQLAVAQANEGRAQESLTRNQADQVRTQATLDAFAADLFQGGGDSQLSVALGATSPDDFATRLVLADTVTSLTNQSLDDLAAAKADGMATQAYLVAVRQEITELKRQAEAALAAANQAKADAQAAKAALDALTSQQQAQASALEAQKAADQASLTAAQAEQAQLEALLAEEARKAAEAEAKRKADLAAAAAAAAKAGTAYTPPASDANAGPMGGYLSYPANGPITSGYAWRLNPITGVWQLHAGIDFGIPCGTPVYATAPGTVVQSGMFYSYGNRVVISHGIVKGVYLATTYNHLSRIVVSSGPVARGQLIAYSGTTGMSTGCHLHFETVENGVRTDPNRWI